MKTKELEAFIAAAHDVIDMNHVRLDGVTVYGMGKLWSTLAAYESVELHKPAHLHPKASEQTDEVLTQSASKGGA